MLPIDWNGSPPLRRGEIAKQTQIGTKNFANLFKKNGTKISAQKFPNRCRNFFFHIDGKFFTPRYPHQFSNLEMTHLALFLQQKPNFVRSRGKLRFVKKIDQPFFF